MGGLVTTEIKTTNDQMIGHRVTLKGFRIAPMEVMTAAMAAIDIVEAKVVLAVKVAIK
jgi:hypothetical protein